MPFLVLYLICNSAIMQSDRGIGPVTSIVPTKYWKLPKCPSGAAGNNLSTPNNGGLCSCKEREKGLSVLTRKLRSYNVTGKHSIQQRTIFYLQINAIGT